MEEESYISVNFGGLGKVLKKEKWLILGLTTLLAVGAIFYALSLKNEYTATGKILPEMKGGNKGGSGLSGLAALAGVSVPSDAGTEAIGPGLYADVLNTTPFHLFLLDQQVPTLAGKETKLADYLQNTFKFKLTPAETIAPMQDGSIVLTASQFAMIKELKKRLTAVMDKKTGVISISAKMQDKVVATRLTTLAMAYLTNYITDYRTQKAKENVSFFQEQMMKAKNKFYSSQAQKAQYADAFQQQYMRMRTVDVQRERIETEYQFSSAFYKSLEQQLEQSKIDLQREIPVIKVLEPPVVPHVKTEPSRSIIVAGAGLLGLVLSLLVSLIKDKNYKLVIEEKKG
jgi:uncharacterized protein involved in exopolysaccharide biosynthesis